MPSNIFVQRVWEMTFMKQLFSDMIMGEYCFRGYQVLIAERAEQFSYAGGGDGLKGCFLVCQVLIAKSNEPFLKRISIGFWIWIDN